MTASAGAVTLTATDNSTITANAGGAGVAGAGGAAGGVSIAVGFGVAHNDIANTVEAYINGSTVSATSGNVSLTAQETSTSYGLSVGAALALAGGGIFAGSAAGTGGMSENTIANTVEAFIDDSCRLRHDYHERQDQHHGRRPRFENGQDGGHHD